MLNIQEENLTPCSCSKRKFILSNIMDIPESSSGVYGMWFKGNLCIYLGKAIDIKRRLTQHWNACHNTHLKAWLEAKGSEIEFCYYTMPKYLIDKREKVLIRFLQPVTNIEGKER